MAANNLQGSSTCPVRVSGGYAEGLEKDNRLLPGAHVADLQLANIGDVDLAHLTSWPPFSTGSFTKTIGNLLRRMQGYQQVAISYWEGDLPEGDVCRNIVLTSRRELSLVRRASLWLPHRLRSRWFCGVSGRRALAYTWQAIEVMRVLKPKLLLCYDAPWQGRLLRRYIDWPCRIILSQRGLSYFMTSDMASQTYSLQSFDAVWCLTNASYRYDRQRMSHYEPTVQVLPNPVDAKRYTPASAEQKRRLRDKFGLPSDRQIVLFLSVLRPKKGAHVLLASWPDIVKQVPDALLWIVGGGDPTYEQYLHDMADALGVSGSVRFHGQVPRELTARCFQASDLYVFPTLFVEGQSLSLLEAMSTGLACVASEHRVALEAYSNEEVLFVRDPNLHNAFVQPVVRVLQDNVLRERMSRLARTHVLKHNDYDVVLPRLEQAIGHELRLVNG